MNSFKLFSLILFLTLVLFSCTKEDAITPIQTNPFGKNLFIGYTGTHDYMFSDSVDNSNIEVRLMSGSNVIRTSLTDSTGRFEFNNLDVGQYDIVVTKEGWCEYRNKSVFCGPGPSPTIFYLSNDNPNGYSINPLVRRVYSLIDTVELDSIRNSRAYFCMVINPSNLDSLDKLMVNIFDRTNPNERLVYNLNDVDFVSPNKYYFNVRSNWWTGEVKLDFLISSYRDNATLQHVLNSRENFEVKYSYSIIRDIEVEFP